ncbi:MAG TPA: FKBP-type peptidyl-prolyl cis-trans isomerase [Polyangiaceae bacterium]|nr:FKBP-type peptidyl-prolyl cis-trans isomerase [Polyangiaceae bacterium]
MAPAENRPVGPEIVVRLEYQLFDAEGELIEAPGPEESIEFIFGSGQAPPNIESAIDGLRVGQSRRVQLRPIDAFGERDEAAVISVAASELPPGIELGAELEAEREDGQTVFLRVIELDGETAWLDANHPLAGQTVALELRVLETRIASSAELQSAAEELDARDGAPAPDVLVARLLRRDRSTPHGSA